MYERDPRAPYLLALFVIGVAVLFSLPMIFDYFENNEATSANLMNNIVEWIVTCVTFSLLSIFTFRETSNVYRETGDSLDLKYSFFAFMIIALFIVAAIFRFGEAIAAWIGDTSFLKMLAGFTVGFAILHLRYLPYFGGMLYASLLMIILGVIVFACVSPDPHVFEIMVAFLVGMLLHVAVINVLRIRAQAGLDEEAPVFPPRFQPKEAKKNRSGSKSKAA